MTRCHADTVLIGQTCPFSISMSNTLSHLPPLCCSHGSYRANLPQSFSVFITSKNSLASLHLSSLSHFISSVSFPPICLQILPALWPPWSLHLNSSSPFFSSLAPPPPPSSFPPANCWSVLAILGVSLPSSYSSCHSFAKKSLKLWAFASVLCMTAWWLMPRKNQWSGKANVCQYDVSENLSNGSCH